MSEVKFAYGPPPSLPACLLDEQQVDEFVRLAAGKALGHGLRIVGDADTIKAMYSTGMTEAEVHAFFTLASAASEVLDLPDLHPMDREEYCHAFHVLQDKLLARPGLRAIGWPIEGNTKEVSR